MSRSKNKIAVTTLLSALACSATTTSAAGTNERDIRSVESQASFSTRKSSESSIKSARSLEGAKSWFEKLPTGAKIAMFVSAPILAAEIYNEIAGAVSGKEWYSGKYSFVNLARGKGEDETKKPDESNDQDANLKPGPNSNLNPNPNLALDMNINNDGKDKKYTNLGNTVIIDEKGNTGLGAAPSSLTKEQEEQLNNVLEKFKEAAKNVPGLYEKFEEKLKDGLIRIIKGRFKIVADGNAKSYAEKFINFVKGENGDYGVKILTSGDSFVIKVSDDELAKRFAISINNDKLQIGEEFILLS